MPIKSAVLILCLSYALSGADKAPPVTQDAPPSESFFSGTVQELSDTSITVSRALPGKNPEAQVFSLDRETVIEGKLKKQVRVTVGYRTRNGQDYAWRIIVRESPE